MKLLTQMGIVTKTCSFILLFPAFSIAATPPAKTHPVQPAAAATADGAAEEVEIKKLREQYWSQGKDAEIGVVQNRLYSKKHKFELSLLGGTQNGDPFLSTNTLGGTVGYYFSEYFSAHATAYKAFSSGSSALTTLIETTNETTNYNKPLSFIGAEGRASLVYGKLSLYGKLILYLDAYVNAGAGSMATESGNNLALFLGIGEQIHISQLVSINIEYRYIRYSETILGKTSLNYGNYITSRTNNSNLVTFGVSLYFGG